MDWLSILKEQQEATPDTIQSFPIAPPDALSKLSKVLTHKQDDVFAPDCLDSVIPANDENRPSLHCSDGSCHCSQKLPAANYPAGCGKCEYLDNPMQPKAPTATKPATFEQAGDPVSCPYWFQVCWAVEMYQEQCTRNSDCRVYAFLRINS